jgi:O-acetyl-ADP-ribose deacetylase (regulator of RNase III)
MSLGEATTAQGLRDSTRAVLALAEKNGVKTLAFPATGTGIAGFGLRPCAQIMLEEVKKHTAGPTGLTDVYFVLLDPKATRVFQDVYEALFGRP